MCNVYCILYTPRVWFQFASSIALASTCMYIQCYTPRVCSNLPHLQLWLPPTCIQYYIVYTSSLFQFASSIALASTCMYIQCYIVYTPRVCSSLPLLSLWLPPARIQYYTSCTKQKHSLSCRQSDYQVIFTNKRYNGITLVYMTRSSCSSVAQRASQELRSHACLQNYGAVCLQLHFSYTKLLLVRSQ